MQRVWGSLGRSLRSLGGLAVCVLTLWLSPALLWGQTVSGRIAYAAHHDIYVMRADGANPTRLTNTKTWEVDPAFSPDGRWIAFYSHQKRGDKWDIYIMRADGTSRRRVTTHPADDTQPSWSPDGKRLVFQSSRDGDPEIFIVSTDGTGLTQLTRNQGADFQPAWSPKGRTIVFVSNRDGNDELYLMDVAGTHPKRLTRTPNIREAQPAWSPDGKTIAYARHARGWNVYLMDADGSNVRAITKSPNRPFATTVKWEPCFSGDGGTLYYHATHIKAVDLGTGKHRRVLKDFRASHPSWGPDER